MRGEIVFDNTTEKGLPGPMPGENTLGDNVGQGATGRIPVAVLGGNGYVAGELHRLLVQHPRFSVVAAISSSQVGERVTASFPHLSGTAADGLTFESAEALTARFRPEVPLGLFAATPHGATAGLLDHLLSAAEKVGAPIKVVDLSADFRYSEASSYEEVYGVVHSAPHRLESFSCAVPEHAPGRPAASPRPAIHAAHPGCFTTATVLAAWPFFAAGLVEQDLFVAAVTGSSGSGRKLGSGTHHPERRSNLYAYSPLSHRHEPEMRRLLARAQSGEEPEVQFVPHSGPFVRGIHATLRMTLRKGLRAPAEAASLLAVVQECYRGSPFIRATLDPPRLIDVIGTNRCHLGVAARGHTLVVTSVIDNLVKGAAGGAVQWMNRIFDLPEETGLVLPGLGWF
jgi:N-acetyl-gamma-glutamyl-phosphate reductase common form